MENKTNSCYSLSQSPPAPSLHNQGTAVGYDTTASPSNINNNNNNTTPTNQNIDPASNNHNNIPTTHSALSPADDTSSSIVASLPSSPAPPLVQFIPSAMPGLHRKTTSSPSVGGSSGGVHSRSGNDVGGGGGGFSGGTASAAASPPISVSFNDDKPFSTEADPNNISFSAAQDPYPHHIPIFRATSDAGRSQGVEVSFELGDRSKLWGDPQQYSPSAENSHFQHTNGATSYRFSASNMFAMVSDNSESPHHHNHNHANGGGGGGGGLMESTTHSTKYQSEDQRLRQAHRQLGVLPFQPPVFDPSIRWDRKTTYRRHMFFLCYKNRSVEGEYIRHLRRSHWKQIAIIMVISAVTLLHFALAQTVTFYDEGIMRLGSFVTILLLVVYALLICLEGGKQFHLNNRDTTSARTAEAIFVTSIAVFLCCVYYSTFMMLDFCKTKGASFAWTSLSDEVFREEFCPLIIPFRTLGCCIVIVISQCRFFFSFSLFIIAMMVFGASYMRYPYDSTRHTASVYIAGVVMGIYYLTANYMMELQQRLEFEAYVFSSERFYAFKREQDRLFRQVEVLTTVGIRQKIFGTKTRLLPTSGNRGTYRGGGGGGGSMRATCIIIDVANSSSIFQQQRLPGRPSGEYQGRDLYSGELVSGANSYVDWGSADFQSSSRYPLAQQESLCVSGGDGSTSKNTRPSPKRLSNSLPSEKQLPPPTAAGIVALMRLNVALTALSEEFGCEKIAFSGDSFIATCNHLTTGIHDHPLRGCKMAFAAVKKEFCTPIFAGLGLEEFLEDAAKSITAGGVNSSNMASAHFNSSTSFTYKASMSVRGGGDSLSTSAQHPQPPPDTGLTTSSSGANSHSVSHHNQLPQPQSAGASISGPSSPPTRLVVGGGASFQLRAGVHTGDIMGKAVGYARVQYIVCGDGVDLAKKCISLGAPNQALVTQETRVLVGNTMQTEVLSSKGGKQVEVSRHLMSTVPSGITSSVLQSNGNPPLPTYVGGGGVMASARHGSGGIGGSFTLASENNNNNSTVRNDSVLSRGRGLSSTMTSVFPGVQAPRSVSTRVLRIVGFADDMDHDDHDIGSGGENSPDDNYQNVGRKGSAVQGRPPRYHPSYLDTTLFESVPLIKVRDIDHHPPPQAIPPPPLASPPPLLDPHRSPRPSVLPRTAEGGRRGSISSGQNPLQAGTPVHAPLPSLSAPRRQSGGSIGTMVGGDIHGHQPPLLGLMTPVGSDDENQVDTGSENGFGNTALNGSMFLDTGMFPPPPQNETSSQSTHAHNTSHHIQAQRRHSISPSYTAFVSVPQYNSSNINNNNNSALGATAHSSMNPLPLSSPHSTQHTATTGNSKAVTDNDDEEDDDDYFDFTRGTGLMEGGLGLRSLTRIREEARPRRMTAITSPATPTSTSPPVATPTKEKRDKSSKKTKRSKRSKKDKEKAGSKSTKKSKKKPGRDTTPARMSGSSSNEMMGWASRSHPTFPAPDTFHAGGVVDRQSPPPFTPQEASKVSNPLTVHHHHHSSNIASVDPSKVACLPLPSTSSPTSTDNTSIQNQPSHHQPSISPLLPTSGTVVHVQNLDSPTVLPPIASPKSQRFHRKLSSNLMSRIRGGGGTPGGSSSSIGSDPITPVESNTAIDRRHADIVSRVTRPGLREDSTSSGGGHGSTTFSNCDVPTDIRMFGVLPIGIGSPDEDDSPIPSARRIAQHAAELERRGRRRSSESSASRGMSGGGTGGGGGGATSGTDEDDDSSLDDDLSEPTTTNTHITKSNAGTHQSMWLVNKHLTNPGEPTRRQSSISFYEMLLHVRSSVDGLFRIHEDLTATTRCAIPMTSFRIPVYEDHYRLRKFHWNGPLYIWFHAGAFLYILIMGVVVMNSELTVFSDQPDGSDVGHSRNPTYITFFAATLSRLVALVTFIVIRATGWRSEEKSTVTALSILVAISNVLLVTFSIASHHFVGLAEPWDVMLLIIFTSIYGPWRGLGGMIQVVFCYILCIGGSIVAGIPLQRNSVVYTLLCVIGYPFAFNLQDMSSRKLYRAVMAADATTGVIEQQKALELHIIEAFAPITIRKVFGLEKLSVGGNANNKKGSCTEDRAVCPYELSRNGTKLVALHFAKQSLGIRTTPLPSSSDLRGLPPAASSSSKESQGLYAVHHGAVVLCLQFDSIHKAARERAMEVWRQRQRELLIRQINLADARLRAPVRNSEKGSGDLGESVSTERFHAAAHRNNLHNTAALSGSGGQDVSFGPRMSGGPDSSGTGIGSSIAHDNTTHYVDTLTNTFWIETVNRLMGYVDESLVFAVQTWHYCVAQSKEELLLPTSAILERSPLTVTSVVGNTVMLAGPFNPPIRRPDVLPPPSSSSSLPKPPHLPATRSERSGCSDYDDDLPKSFHTMGPQSLIGGLNDIVSPSTIQQNYRGLHVGVGVVDWSVIRKYYWSYDPPIEVSKAADMIYAQLYESDRVKFLTELSLLEKGEVEWTTLGEMFKARGVGIKAATSSNSSNSSVESPDSQSNNNSSSGDTPNMGPSYSEVGGVANAGALLPPVTEVTFSPKPIVTTTDGTGSTLLMGGGGGVGGGVTFGGNTIASSASASSKVLYHSVPSYSAFSTQLPTPPRHQDEHLPIPCPNTPLSQTAALVALLFLSHLNRKMNKGRRGSSRQNHAANKSSSGSVGGGVLKKSLPVVDAASSAEVTAALTTSTIFSSMSSTSRTEVVDSCNVFGDALLVARHLIAAAPVSCMVASSNVASVARWTLRQIATISSDATRSSLGLLTSEHVPGDDAQSKEAKRRLKHAVTRLGKLDKQLSLGDEDQKWKIRGRVVRVRTVAFRGRGRRGGGMGAASSSTVFSSKMMASYTATNGGGVAPPTISNLRHHHFPPSAAGVSSSAPAVTAPLIPSPISQPLSSTSGGQDEADTVAQRSLQ